MATIIRTETHIRATPAQVWQVLTDFSGYESWNPFIRSLEGTVTTGKKLRVRIVPPGQKGMTFTPRVLVFEENCRFEWLGHLILPGIFDGRHSFALIDNHDGTTTFVQSETFRGILVPLLKKMLSGPTADGFQLMDAALKRRAEAL